MAKVSDPVGSLDPQAQALYDHLVAKRGRIDGMYRSLLNHPELAQRIGELGSYLRFGDSVLPDEVRELAILRTARRLGAAAMGLPALPMVRGKSPSKQTSFYFQEHVKEPPFSIMWLLQPTSRTA
jgi:hypothetical protein